MGCKESTVRGDQRVSDFSAPPHATHDGGDAEDGAGLNGNRLADEHRREGPSETDTRKSLHPEVTNEPLVKQNTTNVMGESDPPPHISSPSHSQDVRATTNSSARRPSVPAESWYAQAFSEHASVMVSEFHFKNKGKVLFSKGSIPVRVAELDALPLRSPLVDTTFLIGKDLLYGMAYLHNTALYTEHYWRTRVAAADIGPLHNKYDRPYYDMLLGVKVFIDGNLVPDVLPTKDSLPQCTATVAAHEATTTWINVPIVLMGYLNHFTLDTIVLYHSLTLSFVQAAKKIAAEYAAPREATGEQRSGSSAGGTGGSTHDLRVEIVYGCASENNFCTDFIARGSCHIVFDGNSYSELLKYEKDLKQLIVSKANQPRGIILSTGNHGQFRICPHCHQPQKYRCTVCGAEICGSPMCVWKAFAGYPKGCTTHKAQAE